MKCNHSFKYIGSFEDDKVYIRYEECENCGVDKTIMIETIEYWASAEEVAE